MGCILGSIHFRIRAGSLFNGSRPISDGSTTKPSAVSNTELPQQSSIVRIRLAPLRFASVTVLLLFVLYLLLIWLLLVCFRRSLFATSVPIVHTRHVCFFRKRAQIELS